MMGTGGPYSLGHSAANSFFQHFLNRFFTGCREQGLDMWCAKSSYRAYTWLAIEHVREFTLKCALMVGKCADGIKK